MTTFKPPSDNTLTQNTGDNGVNKGGTTDGVISRGLRAEGARDQSAGHVTFDPRDLSNHNLRLSHLSSNFPTLSASSSESQKKSCVTSNEEVGDFPPASKPKIDGLFHSALNDGSSENCPASGTVTSRSVLPANTANNLSPGQADITTWRENGSPSDSNELESGLPSKSERQLKPRESETDCYSPEKSGWRNELSIHDKLKPEVVSSSERGEIRLGVDREIWRSALDRCFSGKALSSKAQWDAALANGVSEAVNAEADGQADVTTDKHVFWKRLADRGSRITDKSDAKSQEFLQDKEDFSLGAKCPTSSDFSGSSIDGEEPPAVNNQSSVQEISHTDRQEDRILNNDRSSTENFTLVSPSTVSVPHFTKQSAEISSERSLADHTVSVREETQSNPETDINSFQANPTNASASGLVAIAAQAPSVALSQCHESYYCGGSVSVLPPIVERTEGDVSTFQPIVQRSEGIVMSTMLPNTELPKLLHRGRKVNLEPFFCRKKSHDCETKVEEKSHEKLNQNTSEDSVISEADVSKVRKVASHQLPTFSLRQKSSTAEQPASQDMVSARTKNSASKKDGTNDKEINMDKEALSIPGKATVQAGSHQGNRIKERQEGKSTPVRPSPAVQPVYDVSMDDDKIRVDISGKKGRGSATVVSASRLTTSTASENRGDFPRHSVSEDDDFSEIGRSFQKWADQRPGRTLTGQDRSTLGSRRESSATCTVSESGNIPPQRTESADSLFHTRSQHFSMDDTLDNRNNSRRKIAPFRPSNSDFNLSPACKHSLTINLETAADKVRRNSVTVLRARPSRVSSPNAHASSPSDRRTSAPRRRHSSTKSTLEKFMSKDTTRSITPIFDVAASLEFLTWTHLLSTYSQSDLQSTSIKKTEIVVNLPVCQVTKGGSTISVTSVDAIEQTLSHFHPNLQVLLGPLGAKDDLSSVGSAQNSRAESSVPVLTTTSTTSLPLSQNYAGSQSTAVTTGSADRSGNAHISSAEGSGTSADLASERNVGKTTLGVTNHTSSNAGGNPRRVSINTCIRTMREGSGNYDSQLMGCENVGNYAEEETLKVVLAKSDAISCVINAMKAFLEKEELQRQACASLLKMASTSEVNCVRISQHGGVTAITNTMRRYQDNLEVTRLALSILGYISTAEEVTAELLSYGCHSDVLAAMSRHSDDRTVVCQCCFILGNLVISVETAQQLMLVGGVHTIISMLRRYHDDRDVLENGCRALGSFALYDDTCLDVAQAGATERVLEAMKSPDNDVCVHECCCWALACLTSIASTCEELVTLNGIPILLKTLEQFPQEEVLQDYGVRTFCNLAALESAVPHLSTSRVINVLISLHQNFQENVELMEYMMLGLSQVAAFESEAQQYLLSEGGLKTVVSVMKSLDENPAIQENGCRILGNLAVNESFRKATEQQGASQVVIAAMLNIEMVPDIQLYGCMALMNLTADLMDNKMRVKNNGAVPTLLATLRQHPDNDEVVLSALKTLGNLVDLEEVCRQLLDDKGLSTIVNIAKNNKAGEEILVFAAQVLSGLTALSDLPVEELLQVEETMVMLQAAIPNDPDLALSMCQGLHNLIKSEIGLETLMQTSWMDVVENTMNKFTTQSEIHLTACRIVATAATKYRRHSKDAGCPLSERTVKRVLQSMRLFPKEKELQLVASASLSCVCESFGHLRRSAMKEGGLQDVMSAMTTFPIDDRLHSVALIAISYLLPVNADDDHRKDIKQASDVICKSMSQFVENEDIQVSGCRALERCDVTEVESVFSLLTSVHNAVRRHKGKTKLMKAATNVFKRFGAQDKIEGMIEGSLESPSTPVSEVIAKFLQK